MDGKREKATLLKVLKRNMYKWHRILGILTVVPVIFWAFSGLSHPIVAHWFKAPIAYEYLKPSPVKPEQLKLSLSDVLQKNGIHQFGSARVVMFAGQTYFQVKAKEDKLSYFSAIDGSELPDGDKLYATYLGRYFLGDSTSQINKIERVNSFDGEYQYVNRLLPVWKLSFDRNDRMDVFVETEQSRLANYNDTNRKVFLWVFRNFHSYAFVEKITNNSIRYVLILVLASIVIFSTLSGLLVYGFLWKKFKKPQEGQQLGFLRRNHRSIGIAVSVVTLSFIGSGAYHASRKFIPDDRINFVYKPLINTQTISFPIKSLPLNWDSVSDISIVNFNNRSWYVVRNIKPKDESWKKEQLSKAESMHAKHHKNEKPDLSYYSTDAGTLLENGAIAHSVSLAQHFEAKADQGRDLAASDVSSTAYLSTFDHDYGFINKRLPVVKLAFNSASNLTYYIEPVTGRLAARVQDSDRREGLSFAVFHKYLLIDSAGKDFRDFFTAFAAMGVLVVSLTGLVLFIKTK